MTAEAPAGPHRLRDAPAALRAELAASIDGTLREEARRTEQTIASIRVFTLLAVTAIEVWLVSGPSALGSAAAPFAAVTAGYLAFACFSWWWLKRSWSPVVSFVLPICDALYMTVRVSAIFVIAGVPHAIQVQELATVTAMASLLAASGGLRLQVAAVGLTTGLGLAQYVGFAYWLGLPLFHASVHLALILAVGLTAAHGTRQVQRAVHSEVVRLTLRRLLPAPVIEAADADPMALLTEPRSLDATVVVTDLRGFTAWAENRAPLEVLDLLNTVQGALAKAVIDQGGTVDKFMGDGMLAVFGAPKAMPDHADRALAAVRVMTAVAERFALAPGVGVHSGDVVVGCIGSGIRMEFTVIGDTVNTASRLQAATREWPQSVLISEATRSRAHADLVPVGEITLRGRSESIVAYTLGSS